MASANSSNAGSIETSAALINDRVNLMASTTFIAFFYGITTTLYCMTTYSLLKLFFRRHTRCWSHSHSLLRSKMEWRRILFYIAYTSVLFVLVTIYTAGTSHGALVAYVDNRLYSKGPYEYFLTFMSTQPITLMVDGISLTILLMTDALILYRFIIFYHRVQYARWLIPLPCAMYVGVIVTSAFVFRSVTNATFSLPKNLLLAYYLLSFSLNVLSTVLIAARLYWHHIQLQRVFASTVDSPYMTLATMLVESGAIYGAWSLAFLILWVIQSPGVIIILATMAQIQVIAPLLIILWAAGGAGWKSARSDGDEPSARPPSSRVRRFSVGSRITRHAGELDEDVFHLNPSPVPGSEGAKHSDGDISLVELGSKQ